MTNQKETPEESDAVAMLAARVTQLEWELIKLRQALMQPPNNPYDISQFQAIPQSCYIRKRNG